MTTVHTFSSTEQAYEAAATNSHVKCADTLVIESEKVIGVADTWPFAITIQRGSLCIFGPEAFEDPRSLARFVSGIKAALREARARGYDVDPLFMPFENL
jgi:hypothetical protein